MATLSVGGTTVFDGAVLQSGVTGGEGLSFITEIDKWTLNATKGGGDITADLARVSTNFTKLGTGIVYPFNAYA